MNPGLDRIDTDGFILYQKFTRTRRPHVYRLYFDVRVGFFDPCCLVGHDSNSIVVFARFGGAIDILSSLTERIDDDGGTLYRCLEAGTERCKRLEMWGSTIAGCLYSFYGGIYWLYRQEAPGMKLGNTINKPSAYKATVMTGQFTSSDFRVHYSRFFLAVNDMLIFQQSIRKIKFQ